jgi:RNA polymerase sigma factor (sigma-70 family)
MAEPGFDMAACLARVAQGDQAAARALVERLHPLVLRLVRAHRARQLDDDDLVQEVFMTMFARLDRYEPRAGIPFEHWLSRLTVNTCRDVLRAESRRPRLAALSPDAGAWLASLGDGRAPAHEDALAARELVDALLQRLPPEDRLVLTLLDLEQRPVAEIAALTGWSRTLVKVRAFRARLRLKSAARALAGESQP